MSRPDIESTAAKLPEMGAKTYEPESWSWAFWVIPKLLAYIAALEAELDGQCPCPAIIVEQDPNCPIHSADPNHRQPLRTMATDPESE